ncbi:hypothetical protein VN97_g11982, partial [Penicillium thymicola]
MAGLFTTQFVALSAPG